MKRTEIDREHLKMLIYGDPGTGKTRFVGTAAADERTAPVLYLNMGGNPVSMGDYKYKPDMIEIEDMSDFNPIYAWLRKGQPANDPLVQMMKLNPPYKTVIMDQLTAVQRSAFKKVMGTTSNGPGDILPATQIQHFGAVLAMMVNWANRFYELPDLHVIVVVLEAGKRNEATGTVTYAPLLWGQSEGEVGGIAYMVARMVNRAKVTIAMEKKLTVTDDSIDKDAVSVALLKTTGTYAAKDQYGTGLAYIADPTITKVLDAIASSGGNPAK